MREKELNFNGELQFEEVKLENVPCKIILPEAQNGKVTLEARIQIEQGIESLPTILYSDFSLRASFSFDSMRMEIYAAKVYRQKRCMSWGKTNQEYLIIKAEPRNLKIQEINKSSQDKQKVTIYYFWLTQSIHLPPSDIHMTSCDGSISIQKFRNLSFEVTQGINLDFVEYYFHSIDSVKKNRKISEAILAAKFSDFTGSKLDEEILSEIDIFLRIVSFSERRRIACYGYKAFVQGNESKVIDFYRSGLIIPEENFNYSQDNILIDGQDFEEFIVHSLQKLRDCAFKEHLLEAIVKAVQAEDSILESQYLTYYSALENLVNGHRKIEFILGEEPFKDFRKKMKEYIKKHSSLADVQDDADGNKMKKNQRKSMYEKIPELNRVSFDTAFKSFCESYSINIDDLWPLRCEASLSSIRNRIIHGERFEREEHEALIAASMNLRWILERCILRVLDWDVNRSRIKNSSLEQYTPYTNWKEFQGYLVKK
jgi:hypothetical protein